MKPITRLLVLTLAASVVACSEGVGPSNAPLPTSVGGNSGNAATPTPVPTPTSTPAASARYVVEFHTAWSRATHPQDFPSNPHFSGLIGATHDSRVRFWTPGEPASEGIRLMAERGSKSPLSDEIDAAINAGTGRYLLSGGGIGNSPGGVSLEFNITREHPLVSLVSMIAPSPDWFVGVRDLNLVDAARGQWADEVTVTLFPWDAGTDSGVSYASADLETRPRGVITAITGAPFALNGSVGAMGVMRFIRIP